MSVEDEIREIIDRETRAWDTNDVHLLLTIFHPDKIWPLESNDHDPVKWVAGMGRYNYKRLNSGRHSLILMN